MGPPGPSSCISTRASPASLISMPNIVAMPGTEPPVRAGATLEIDLDAVIANWQILRRQHAAGAVGAVVKADAYGLGARSVVPALHGAGCRHFFVASLDEALAIRDLMQGAM